MRQRTRIHIIDILHAKMLYQDNDTRFFLLTSSMYVNIYSLMATILKAESQFRSAELNPYLFLAPRLI